MNTVIFAAGVPTGATPGGIALAGLEFSTVILFLIGGLAYWRLTKVNGNKSSRVLALLGTLSCFVGGLPNACDKLSWALFEYDLWFNSTWMFFFVGIGYLLLYLSAWQYCRAPKSAASAESKLQCPPLLVFTAAALAATAVPGFHKPMKYCFMLLSTVGMFLFYTTLFRRSRKIIGASAAWYIVAICMTLFLAVFAAAAEFDALWPNMLAQTCNNISYIGFICANVKWRKALQGNG